MNSNMHEFFDGKTYHFVGIGGCGMSALAAYVQARGARVTGSDMRPSPFVDRLWDIPVHIGHAAHNVPDQCDEVVYSSAIKPDNPELIVAREREIPASTRGAFLSQAVQGMYTVAIVGSHGKTSTAALLTWIARCAGRDPSSLVGGIMNNVDRNVLVGSSDLLITEADESDGSMALIEPDVLIMLNIDDDHMQHYGSKERMLDAYEHLIDKTKDAVICNGADEEIRALMHRCRSAKTVFFNTPDTVWGDPDSCRCEESSMTFDLRIDGTSQQMRIGLFGHVFLANMAAAVACARYIGIPVDPVKSALATYRGVKRRMEHWGIVNNICIIEDYAHHPTEISAMLRAARQWHRGRIVCVFQPHRYTRSQQIAHLLADAFKLADILILTDIYTADEPPIAGVTGEFVYHTVAEKRTDTITYIADMHNVVEHLLSIVAPADTVVFMGAGTVGSYAPQFKQELEHKQIARV